MQISFSAVQVIFSALIQGFTTVQIILSALIQDFSAVQVFFISANPRFSTMQKLAGTFGHQRSSPRSDLFEAALCKALVYFCGPPIFAELLWSLLIFHGINLFKDHA